MMSYGVLELDYEVYISYGTEGTVMQSVSDVESIDTHGDSCIFYNKANEVLFLVQQKQVIFIEKK